MSPPIKLSTNQSLQINGIASSAPQFTGNLTPKIVNPSKNGNRPQKFETDPKI
jgi:hypothetical protein